MRSPTPKRPTPNPDTSGNQNNSWANGEKIMETAKDINQAVIKQQILILMGYR